jgi:hypothetical protein
MAEITSITEDFMGEKFDPLTSEEVVTNLNRANQPKAELVNDGKPLPEAEFNIPTSNTNESTNKGGSNGGTQQTTSEPKFNQDFDNLPEEEQEAGAEIAADMIIGAYVTVTGMGYKVVEISEKKLIKMEQNGEIDLRTPIPISPNNNRKTTILDITRQHNERLKPTFETSPETIAAAKPVLVSILKKKGVALSPEHQLMYIVGMDLFGKGVALFQGLQVSKELLNTMREVCANQKAANVVNTPNPSFTNTQNRREPDEPTISVNEDNVQTFQSNQRTKEETVLTSAEISKKLVDLEERKIERKKRKSNTPKVRKQRVVVKADDGRGINQN